MFIADKDTDECSTNNGGCEQSCHNTIGSYYCSCSNNYTLNTDHHHCDGMIVNITLYLLSIHFIDVNECSLGIDQCNQNCVNTPGSYQCYCNAGYHLMSEEKTCAGKLV